MGENNGPRWAREHTLLGSAARVADGVSNVINAGEYGSAIFFFEVTAAAGTLNATLQFSPDNSTWYDSSYAISEMGVVSKQMLVVPALGRYVRFDYDVTGSVTFSITGAFKS
jgi:hypothetical protein